MRAYMTAGGIALGLVAVWAALVPFVAWDPALVAPRSTPRRRIIRS